MLCWKNRNDDIKYYLHKYTITKCGLTIIGTFKFAGTVTFLLEFLQPRLSQYWKAKSTSKGMEYYSKVLSDIADDLDWELVLECDDDENENVVLRAIST